MRRARPFRTLASALLCTAALAGCQTGASGQASSPTDADNPDDPSVRLKAGEGGTLVPKSEPQVEDLPVPIGFKLDEDASRAYNADQSRLIDHIYRGPATKREVEQFYQYNMPLHGWRFRGSQQIGQELTLRYEKNNQWCDVELRRWNRLFGEGTIIRLTVQTLATSDESS